MTNEIHIEKAQESLASAYSELASRRYNCSANRAYYACFQAAIAVLIPRGLVPRAHWSHQFVQSRFAGALVARRKLYPAPFAEIFNRLMLLRHDADYRATMVSPKQAHRRAARRPHPDPTARLPTPRHRRPAPAHVDTTTPVRRPIPLVNGDDSPQDHGTSG